MERDTVKLSIAISPCPNDTFMFGPLALGLVKTPSINLEFSYFDIEELNQQAISGKYDISKVSFATWLDLKEKYKILKIGAALSENSGPLLVSRPETEWPPAPKDICLLPGEHTTAHLLFRLWSNCKEINGPLKGSVAFSSIKCNKKFVIYDEIMDMVTKEKADFGVIIHESRFMAEKKGLKIVCDLGRWWTETTKLPIPLGCLIASNNLDDSLVQLIESKILESISFARGHEDTIMEYIKEHAVELDEQIVNRHIETFVNEQSLGINDRGWKAISKLEEMAAIEKIK